MFCNVVLPYMDIVKFPVLFFYFTDISTNCNYNCKNEYGKFLHINTEAYMPYLNVFFFMVFTSPAAPPSSHKHYLCKLSDLLKPHTVSTLCVSLHVCEGWCTW